MDPNSANAKSHARPDGMVDFNSPGAGQLRDIRDAGDQVFSRLSSPVDGASFTVPQGPSIPIAAPGGFPGGARRGPAVPSAEFPDGTGDISGTGSGMVHPQLASSERRTVPAVVIEELGRQQDPTYITREEAASGVFRGAKGSGRQPGGE